MNYRLLGRSGLAVSELCLGAMTFGNTTNEQDSIEMIRRFFEKGGNFIDTADVYVNGRSEEIVGKAIQGKRSETVLATKVRMATSGDINGAGQGFLASTSWTE
ncbi:aldo/keto reductase [Paenibacillus harenae]|uniref:Aryl-alcohol dehydrogenase-like predicted oxidoreductase n=1 Tax=Paenibacillus harenae TaxID=306543 RepID=A0ABT9TZ87_PAEHA|nr:aldo/keto reductase [Paenibacillus harenae]MDQ0111384.1 aryl-alcohol dehydrogenase-like predicted oxidoreductase [Paenibacillus harenae]